MGVCDQLNRTTMKNILLLISTWLGILTNVQGQSFNSDELEAKIDSLIPKEINDTTAGLVLGIVKNGELIFSKGYGLANLSYGMPNDPKMVYNLGSVSKQFLGYAFAMLHVEGKLDIDDPVGKYLEDWPEFEHAVTLRHLLTHTSGYREAYTMSNLSGRYIGVDRLSKEECLEVVRKQPQLEFIPGSRWTYNSTAWVILAEVLEKVTGESADEWVEKNILMPLEMNDTQIESHVGEVIKYAAESYNYNEKRGYINPKSNRAIFGAADVYSSVQDLVKWVNNYRTAEVGGRTINEIFLEPFILNDGFNSGYALGISNNSYRGLKHYGHTGGHEAFVTQLSYYPEHNFGIITISNFGGKARLNIVELAEFFLQEHMTSMSKSDIKGIKIKKNKLEQYAGQYLRFTMNRIRSLTIENDSLLLDGEHRLTPVEKNIFQIDGQEGRIQIETISGEIRMTFFNPTVVYTRIDSWSPTLEELSEYKGDYWSDELETVYHLTLLDEKLTIKHRWIGELVLEPVGKDVFQVNGGFFVKFNRDEQDNISELAVFTRRTLNVRFQRME